MSKAKILIIDDDQELATMLAMMVRRQGHEATMASTLANGVAMASQENYTVVFLDVNMPDGNGLEYIPQIRSCPGTPEVIIITGIGERRGAELAINNGAWDYIEKTSLARDFELPLTRALQYHQEKRRKAPISLQRQNIIGTSPQLQNCLELVAKGAASSTNVLLTGATGTGKELFAQAIHQNSARAKQNFVVVDCAALPEKLVESILFGYRQGAFSGADHSQDGLLRQADGGTLFLDEVGELPLRLQKAFLRALQERRFRPLGSKEEITSDFRLLAATNQDLNAMVKAGTFRQDLLYRLNSLTISLPPLWQRPEDIRPLALSFISAVCQHQEIPVKGISADFFEALEAYDWPGNVRELKNTIDQVLTTIGSETNLFANHLPNHIRVKLTTANLPANTPPPLPASPSINATAFPSLKEYRQQAYKTYAQSLLAHFGHDKKKACAYSGLSRSRLYAFLKDHGEENSSP